MLSSRTYYQVIIVMLTKPVLILTLDETFVYLIYAIKFYFYPVIAANDHETYPDLTAFFPKIANHEV